MFRNARLSEDRKRGRRLSSLVRWSKSQPSENPILSSWESMWSQGYWRLALPSLSSNRKGYFIIYLENLKTGETGHCWIDRAQPQEVEVGKKNNRQRGHFNRWRSQHPKWKALRSKRQAGVPALEEVDRLPEGALQGGSDQRWVAVGHRTEEVFWHSLIRGYLNNFIFFIIYYSYEVSLGSWGQLVVLPRTLGGITGHLEKTQQGKERSKKF